MPRTELILHSVCAELHIAYIQYKLNSLEKRYKGGEEELSISCRGGGACSYINSSNRSLKEAGIPSK
jgi:hypothetical protein